MKYGATENSNFSTLEPIPEMSTDNADITLIFLYTNAVTYPQPVDDPFFPAHWPVVRKFVTWKNITTYKSDHPFAAIGCKVQVRPMQRAHSQSLIYLPVSILLRPFFGRRPLHRAWPITIAKGRARSSWSQ